MCFRLSPYIRPLRSPFPVTAAYCVYAARDEKTLLARRIVVIHAVLYFAFLLQHILRWVISIRFPFPLHFRCVLLPSILPLLLCYFHDVC